MIDDSKYYKESWNQYYSEYTESQDIPWVVDPEISTEENYQLFKNYFDPTLELLDLGCGLGQEAAYLKRYFDKISGSDISEKGILLAKEKYSAPGLNYFCMNALDAVSVNKLSKEKGDMNIYMRGLIQQLKANDLNTLFKNLAILSGQSGYIFFKELNKKAPFYFMNLLRKYKSSAIHLKRVIEQGVTKMNGLNEIKIREEIEKSGLEIIILRETVTNIQLPDGKTGFAPSLYGILKN